MAHTFDIRFARSSSFAGLFEASLNSFGWRGNGQLTIDSMALEVGVKRSFTSLFLRRRSHRIRVDQISEVYREGEALRIEFSDGARSREILPVWAQDRGSAARIVELLPTTNTIELEQTPSDTRPRPASSKRALVMPVLLTAVLLVSIFVLMPKRPTPTTASPSDASVAGNSIATPPTRLPDETVVQAAMPSPAAESSGEPAASMDASADTPVSAPAISPPAAKVVQGRTTQQPAAASPASGAEPDPNNFVPTVPEIEIRAEDLVVPLRQGSLAYDAARDILKQFEQMASELGEKYRKQRQLSDAGQLDADAFARGLDALEGQWRQQGMKLLDPAAAKDPVLSGFLTTLGAVVTYQSNFLSGYAAAVRAKDANATAKAFEDLARAEKMLERAKLYVR
jgi:hypothetical protein